MPTLHDTPDLLELLRRSMPEHTHNKAAAITLLAEHESWLHRPDFGTYVHVCDDGAGATIDVHAAYHALINGELPGTSGSAETVLHLAAWLYKGDAYLERLDHVSARHAGIAVMRACGFIGAAEIITAT